MSRPLAARLRALEAGPRGPVVCGIQRLTEGVLHPGPGLVTVKGEVMTERAFRQQYPAGVVIRVVQTPVRIPGADRPSSAATT